MLPSAVPVLISVLAATSALAGEADVEVDLDVFTANSTSEAPGSGGSAKMSSTELGMRIRGRLFEVDDRLEIGVDYRGREPIAGQFRNETLRSIYQLDAQFEVVEDRLRLGLGRFIAPSILFLPVDGLRAEVNLSDTFTVGAFGGRRAITTSRRNVGFGDFLPAFGVSANGTGSNWSVQGLFARAEDQAPLVASGQEILEPYTAMNAAVRGHARPNDELTVGAQLTLAERATYVLGPRWVDATIEVESLGLYNGSVWATITPKDWVTVDLNLQTQRTGITRVETTFDDESQVEVLDPNFSDTRLRVALKPGELGWIRADNRVRVRHDRLELRLGGGIDALNLGVPGLFAKGRLWIEDILGDPDYPKPVDRLFWSAEVGYHDHGLDLSVGTSHVERADNPVSSRQSDPGNPLDPARSVDLAPFVLETNNIVFLRAFYSDRMWFGGLDFEQSLEDPEFRLMAQAGVLWGESW